MAYHDMNRYGLGRDRRPSSRQYASSTMSSSRLATNGMSYMDSSPGGHQRTNSNSHYMQSPEIASYQDGTAPVVISPLPEAEFSYMQSQALYVEEPRADYILNGPQQLDIPAHTATLHTGHPSPWSAYRTDMSPDHNGFLNVPGGYQHSRGAAGTARSSVSTVSSQYTASSDGHSDVGHERIETRRGGRQPGLRLPEATVLNIRQVRDTGACIRCRTLRMKCSEVTPCLTCNELHGRKWGRCLRSFSEMAELLKPVILSKRLNFDNMEGWIREHASFPPGLESFELPLSFGFGERFEGLNGIEYIPTSGEAQRSDTIGHGDQPRISLGLAVCPVYESADAAQRIIWQWLKRTLTSARSMDEWLRRCSSVEWIRKLLQSTWKYSLRCWDERNHGQVEDVELDDNLLQAWMAALLVTMLALPITIPKEVVPRIVRRLRFSGYSQPFPNSSRALTRAVKALFFDMYRQFVDRLTSALRDFERLKSEEISDRRLGHAYCIAILVIVITCQIQTSLMDNVQLDSSVQGIDPSRSEITHEHMRDAEGAFRNTIMFVKHENVKRLKKRSISDDKVLLLRRTIREVGQVHRDAIKGHRNIDLEVLINRPNNSFLESNMQRVFALFFDIVRKDRE